MRSIDAVHHDTLRRDLPPFRAGDTVRVHVKIKEGEKERIQVFEGVVIQRRGGGADASFTVRKISSGVGVERIFPVESPIVTKVEIKSRGHVRRARLFYLRGLAGKKARLRTKIRDLSALVAPSEKPGTADSLAATEEAKLAEAAAAKAAAVDAANEPASAEAPAGKAPADAATSNEEKQD